jgi:hypothetical protein
MNMLKLITALTLAATLMVVAMPSTASAETLEQKQKLEQEVEIECTSGAYGQNTTCKAKGKQTGEQSQKMEGYFNSKGQYIRRHKVANTGLDTMTLSAVAGTLMIGSAAAVAKFKTRA